MSSVKQNVLVVEDDAGVALLERRALERRGFGVTNVATISEALAAVKSSPFDLIVADYRLETGTGLELISAVQNLGLDIPVILVTGFSDEAVVIEAIRRGARDFVPKTAEYLHYLPEAVERVLRAVWTERQLARSEKRFQLFMENSPTVAFIKDEEGRLLYANRATETLLPRSDWHGRTDAELWPEDVAKDLRANDLEVLNGCRVNEVEETIRLANGELRKMMSYKFPMQDSAGRKFVGGMAVDITQQRAAEESLRQRDEQLRQVQKMEAIGTLAGGVAHEFNNLLQSVLGYTRFAMSAIGEMHEAHADLEIVVAAGERAAVLTQQLLSFSRPETNKFQPLDIKHSIQEMVTMLRPLLGAQVQIDVDLADDLGPLAGGKAEIQQLLMNLCINARDAMPDGGRISIATRAVEFSEGMSASPVPRSGKYLKLTVADTGSGMTPEVKQKIFEPFFTTKPVGKGTGLGLAMVFNAVQHHSGAIHVDSLPHVGSRFTIYLPLSESAQAPAVSTAKQVTPRGSGMILLAEDEPLVLELARRMLTGAGFQVVTATDGVEAIRLFREHQANIVLVILDVVMPNLNGWGALCEIRRLQPQIPALFASGFDRERSPTISEGAAPKFIQKPFVREHLLAVVREVLEEAAVSAPV